MSRQILAVAALGFAVAVGLAACEEKGPTQITAAEAGSTSCHIGI
jgi:hypothetical protein